MTTMKSFIIFLIISFISFSSFAQTDITENELKEHLQFLTSESNAGRPPGGKINRRIVKYIIKDFKQAGVRSYHGKYKQKFYADLRVYKGEPKKDHIKTYNVIGYLEGNDPKLKEEIIVLGAHYDHLGMGGPSSKSDKRNTIHYGADDNASGTAALLEIAEKLASQKSKLKRSILFISFGAEEHGLLGSKYFVNNPVIPLSQIKLMINMDMVGRLNDQKHVYMGGAGTFPNGVELMTNLGEEQGLNPMVHAGSVGGSDHVSFYKKDISVIGIHTGGHPQYHTPEDTLDLINLKGQKAVSEYVYQTVLSIATNPDELHFIRQD